MSIWCVYLYGVYTWCVSRAGIVPHLPVPLLIRRGCPIAHQKQIRPHREAHQKQIVPHREGNQEQTDADALSRRDTCLGECGVPPLKPRSGRTRGFILDGLYYRHPPAGDGEHPLNPNQRDGRHLAGQPGRHFKRSTRSDIWEEREREGRMRSGPRATRGSRRP